MALSAVLLGLLGLVAVTAGALMMNEPLFFGGGALSVAAIVLGLLARPAKAGMVLGLLGALACAGLALHSLTAPQVPPSGR